MNKFKQKLISLGHSAGLLSKLTRKNFTSVIRRYASLGQTLDIGCGGSPYAQWFPNRVALDIVPSPEVAIIADVHNLSVIVDGTFDNVLCTEALEHFYNPFLAIQEIKRILKTGGRLILSTRFIFPLHEVPQDYFRFTEYGLRHLLGDFDILELRADGNTMETLAILYQRIGYQSETLWFKPFKLWWFIKAKLASWCSGILTKHYGDIEHSTEIRELMTSGYLVIAQKK